MDAYVKAALIAWPAFSIGLTVPISNSITNIVAQYGTVIADLKASPGYVAGVSKCAP